MKLHHKLKALPPKPKTLNPFESLGYAFSGLYLAFIREGNIRIQLFLGLSLTAIGAVYGHYVSSMANFILMGVVISLEMINSSIETLCDVIHPESHEAIKIVKDMAAGAVLMAALVWLVTIFYLLSLFFGFNILKI